MQKSQRKAYTQLLAYLARRDHSVLELREKLSLRYDEKEIEESISRAQAAGYIRNPEELAQDLVEKLNRQGKGYLKILQKLEKMGLPSVNQNFEQEIEKALDLMQSRFGIVNARDLSEKQKIYRFLLQRGFDSEVVRKVIHEER